MMGLAMVAAAASTITATNNAAPSANNNNAENVGMAREKTGAQPQKEQQFDPSTTISKAQIVLEVKDRYSHIISNLMVDILLRH